MLLHSYPAPEDVDAVIFDAGGVLVLPDAEAGRAAVAALDWQSSPQDWHRAHYAANLVLDQMETTSDWTEHRRAIAAELGVPQDQIEAAVPLIESVIAGRAWVAVDGAATALRELSEAGFALAVVSNAWGTMAQWLEQSGICSVDGGELTRVAAVIDSALVGIEKPDPRIFQLAIDALGVDPARSLYVGDTIKFDVTGALAAGLVPVHVDPYDFCDGAHSHIATLADLTGWLVADRDRETA